MPTLRQVFLNSFAQIIGKVVTAGSTFIVTILVARSLGQGGFGEFTLMTTYAAMFYIVADFGFNAIALRLAAGDEAKLRSSYASLLGLRTIYGAGLVFTSLAILSFFPYSPLLKLGTIVTILTILTQSLFTSANLVFQFRSRYDLSVVASSVGALLNLALIYVLSQGSLSLLGIAVSYVASGVAMAVVALLLVRTLIGKVGPSFDTGQWARLTWLTLPVGLTLLFNLVYFRADTFILSFYKPTTEVGIYGAAYKFFEVALVLPTFFMNALYPHLIKSYEENRDQFRQMVRYSILGLAGVGTFGAALGVMLSPWFFGLVYQGKFDESVLPFQILIASLPIFFLSSLYMWLMLILKRQKTMALVYAGGMMINIALNLYFIPTFSYLAAAITTGVSEALILLLTYYLSRDWKSVDKSSEPVSEERLV